MEENQKISWWKTYKLDEKNGKKNRMMEFDFLALGSMLKKSYGGNEGLGRKTS